MTDFMKYARRRGMVPDWVLYQINGKSAHENWMEQHNQMQERFADQEDADDPVFQFVFSSEVKTR